MDRRLLAGHLGSKRPWRPQMFTLTCLCTRTPRNSNRSEKNRHGRLYYCLIGGFSSLVRVVAMPSGVVGDDPVLRAYVVAGWLGVTCASEAKRMTTTMKLLK